VYFVNYKRSLFRTKFLLHENGVLDARSSNHVSGQKWPGTLQGQIYW